MTLTIELDPQTEAQLAAASQGQGIDAPELVRRMLREHLPPASPKREVRAENQPLIDLIKSWRKEDESMTEQEIAEEERIQSEFEAGIYQAQREQGMRLL